MPLETRSREYAVFLTPVGLFQFTTLPFRLHGAPAIFQQLMDRILQDCNDCCGVYLDNMVIYSRTWSEHLQHLQRVLHQIQEPGLTSNVWKCEWAKIESKYLGYLVGKGVVRPQVDKVEAIANSAHPPTWKQVRSFLGPIGWYRRLFQTFPLLLPP